MAQITDSIFVDFESFMYVRFSAVITCSNLCSKPLKFSRVFKILSSLIPINFEHVAAARKFKILCLPGIDNLSDEITFFLF